MCLLNDEFYNTSFPGSLISQVLNPRVPTPPLAKKVSRWSVIDWKTAAYKADVTATASYVIVDKIFEKVLTLEGDYSGQAKAWKIIRDLAHQGAEERITPEEFLAKRQAVYHEFGLRIPSQFHLYARYNTLQKWAGHPSNYPDLFEFASFLQFQSTQSADFHRLTNALRELSCSKWNAAILYKQLNPITTNGEEICKLLAQLNQDPEPLLRQFNVWFGDDEGGFASTLMFHLRDKVHTQWSDCWNPMMHLVGSARHNTALYGADLDIVIELNHRSEDAVTYTWANDHVSNVVLKGKGLGSQDIIHLCDAFMKAYENKKTQAHPKDGYELKSAKEPNYRRMRLTLILGNTTVDLIPALRGSDGSFLYFGSDGKEGNLVYSNGSEALRIITPYKEWKQFLEVVRCLKLLFQEEWNSKHPKVFGCMSETLAIDVALILGRNKWEETDFRNLLHACLDKLLWYIETKTPLPSLNDPLADLLPARDNVQLVTQLVETIKHFKELSAEEIARKLKTVIQRVKLDLESK